jgi:hypothetical protein
MIHDFTVPDDGSGSRALKTSTLEELAGLFFTWGSCSLPLPHVTAIWNMACANVLRDDATFPTARETSHFSAVMVEPCMPHLTQCYRICGAIIDNFPNEEFMGFSLVRRLLKMTQLPDLQERSLIADLLKRYYNQHADQRVHFMQALRDHLIAIRTGILIPLAAAPSFLVVAHCVTVSLKAHRPLVHNLIVQGVLPLIESDYLPVFWSALKLALVQVIIPSLPEVGIPMCLRLQNAWPVQNGGKENCCVQFAAMLPALLAPNVFDRIARHFFLFMSSLLSSPHFQVVLEALSIYERLDMRPLIRSHTPFVLDRYFPATFEHSSKHWNHDVRIHAAAVLTIMEKEWPADFVRSRKAAQYGSNSKSSSSGNPKLQQWQQIIMAALPEPERKAMIGKAAAACQFDLDPRKKRSHFMPYCQHPEFKDLFRANAVELPRTCSASLPPINAGALMKGKPSAGLGGAGGLFPRAKGLLVKPLV